MVGQPYVAVLPWWPHEPSVEEVVGLESLRRLNGLPLICCAPTGCDVPRELGILRVERFDPSYFVNQWAYSRLLLSQEFYSRFQNCRRIVIVQSDVLLLRPLTEAALQLFEFDYTGPPWVAEAHDGALRFDGAGNGGFSMRDQTAFCRTLRRRASITMPLLRFATNINRMGAVAIICTASLFGRSVGDAARFLVRLGVHEDTFWAKIAPLLRGQFSVCPPELAASFGVERKPEFAVLFAGPEGPIAAHAWKKHGGAFFDHVIKEGL